MAIRSRRTSSGGPPWTGIALAIFACSSGCQGSAPERPPGARVRYIFVERSAEELFPPGSGIAPQAKLLRMEPLLEEGPDSRVDVRGSQIPLEVLSVTPRTPVTPGEEVTAWVRLARSDPGGRYRISARPSRAGVLFLGAPSQVVLGREPVPFRFTSRSTGRAGIVLGAEPMEALREAPRP